MTSSQSCVIQLYTQRVQFGGPRHGAFPSSADTIDSGFSYNQPLFAALPAELDNPAGTPTVGVYQGKCVTTAIGGVSFGPETLECFQTYYFIIDENGSYADSISYTQAFFLNFDASTPGAITGGTGKYRFIRGEIIGAGTFTSPSGNYTYDGTTLNFLLI